MTNVFQCAVDCDTEPFHDHVDVAGRRDIGRGEQHMVAALAVGSAAGRIAAEPASERRGLDPLMQLQLGIERLPCAAVSDQLDPPEQAAAPDVADMAVIAETLDQPLLELAAALLDLVEQPLDRKSVV